MLAVIFLGTLAALAFLFALRWIIDQLEEMPARRHLARVSRALAADNTKPKYLQRRPTA